MCVCVCECVCECVRVCVVCMHVCVCVSDGVLMQYSNYTVTMMTS